MTRLVALVGHPVAESLSPRMQNAAFAARALDWVYVACDVDADELDDAVRGLAALGFAGANVTTPNKIAVARLVDADVPSANTLVIRDGEIRGYSTDAVILAEVDTSSVAILGGGGSAAAFAHALPDAKQFVRSCEWPPRVVGIDVIVNATSERDAVLVELKRGQTLIDLPYPRTATAHAAEEAGARVIDGLEVLVAQGAAAFELWTGIPAPIDVMRAAVRSA